MSYHPPIKIGAFVLILIAMSIIFTMASDWVNETPTVSPEFGITFSTHYAKQLGLDYQKTYKALIEELEIQHVRIPVYWSEIEREQGWQDWGAIDWLMTYSEEHNVQVTLVVGIKVPRWPECFVPDWAEKLNTNSLHQEALRFIELTVNRYKDFQSVVGFQVENEPFFPYGICPDLTAEQFQERVDLVRSLVDQPVQVTVSGEVGPWLDAAQSADILGISLYRQTWNDIFGYFIYPLSPEFYYVRIGLIGPSVEKVIISELQAEPWFPEAIENREPIEWYEYFTADTFEQNINFVKKTGVKEAYLWGAEWWYFLRENGEPRLWDYASTLFK
jgi:hypothetical protein